MAWKTLIVGTVTEGEAEELKIARAEVDRGNEMQAAAQLAASEANILVQALQIRLQRKYKLRNGDVVDPETKEIRRQVPADDDTSTDGAS